MQVIEFSYSHLVLALDNRKGQRFQSRYGYLFRNNSILVWRYHQGIIFIRYNLRDSPHSRPKGHSRNNKPNVQTRVIAM